MGGLPVLGWILAFARMTSEGGVADCCHPGPRLPSHAPAFARAAREGGAQGQAREPVLLIC